MNGEKYLIQVHKYFFRGIEFYTGRTYPIVGKCDLREHKVIRSTNLTPF